MAVTVVLPGPLRELAGGRASIALAGAPATVAEAFAALRRELPAVYDRLLTERAELRPHINVFVGEEEIRRRDGLGTPLQDGDEVVVLPSVSGG